MSKVEELERVIEQLPTEDFEKLSVWMALRRKQAETDSVQERPAYRDHRAFLNSYAPEDERLYDDAEGR